MVRAIQDQAARVIFAQQNCVYTHTAQARRLTSLLCCVAGRISCTTHNLQFSTVGSYLKMCAANCTTRILTSPKQLGLIERLKKVVPAPLDTFFFVNSGAEAVENAIKIARAETGRLHVLCFENAFHGRTLGALSVTTSKNVYRRVENPFFVVLTCISCR